MDSLSTLFSNPLDYGIFLQPDVLFFNGTITEIRSLQIKFMCLRCNSKFTEQELLEEHLENRNCVNSSQKINDQQQQHETERPKSISDDSLPVRNISHAPQTQTATSFHPPAPWLTKEVLEVVGKLNQRNGSSLYAIKKGIADDYKLDSFKLAPRICKAVKELVRIGKLIQTKGTGASGSFKLNILGDTPTETTHVATAKAASPKVKQSLMTSPTQTRYLTRAITSLLPVPELPVPEEIIPKPKISKTAEEFLEYTTVDSPEAKSNPQIEDTLTKLLQCSECFEVYSSSKYTFQCLRRHGLVICKICFDVLSNSETNWIHNIKSGHVDPSLGLWNCSFCTEETFDCEVDLKNHIAETHLGKVKRYVNFNHVHGKSLGCYLERNSAEELTQNLVITPQESSNPRLYHSQSNESRKNLKRPFPEKINAADSGDPPYSACYDEESQDSSTEAPELTSYDLRPSCCFCGVLTNSIFDLMNHNETCTKKDMAHRWEKYYIFQAEPAPKALCTNCNKDFGPIKLYELLEHVSECVTEQHESDADEDVNEECSGFVDYNPLSCGNGLLQICINY